MTTLHTEETIASQSPPTNRMRLQLDIFAEDQWAHSLEVPVGKCTIGSSPSCQIRLSEKQVRPLHCLLLHGSEGVTATSWAPGMLLNDQEFSSAPLYVGDELSIGNLRLKLAVADPGDSSSEKDAEYTSNFQPDPAQIPDPSPDPHPPQSADESTEICDVHEIPATSADENLCLGETKLSQSNQQARQRCRRLLEGLRHQRDLAKNLRQEVVAHTDRREAVEQERDSLAAELEQLRTTSSAENRSLAEQLQILQGERDSHVAELEQLRTSSSAETRRLTEQLQTLQGERNWLASEVEQVRSNSVDETQQLNEQVQSLQQERDSLAGDLEQLRTNSAQQTHNLTEQLQNSHAERDSLFCELEQLHANSAERDSQQSAELDRVFGELTSAYEKTTQAEEALREAQARSEEFQHRIEELIAECERLANSSQTLHEQKEQLAQTIAERDCGITELEQELRVAQEVAQVAGEKLAEQMQSREKLFNELTALHAERIEAESEIERLKRESDELQRTSSDYLQQLHAAEESLRVVSDQLEQQTEELESLRKELPGLQAERHEFSVEKEKLIQETDAKRKRIELLEIDVKSLNREWQQSLAEVSRLKEAQLAAETRIEYLETEQANFDKDAFEALSTERNELANELRDLQEDIAARDELLQNAYERLEQLQAIVSQSEDDHAALAEDIAARIGQIELLTDELDALRENVARHGEERIQYTEQLTDREKTIEQLHVQFDALRTSITQVEQERNEIAQRLASQETQFAQITAELEAQRSKAERYEEERLQHVEGLSACEKQIESLTNELDNLRTGMMEVEQERDQLVERLAFQETHSAELSSELEAMRSNDSGVEQENEQYAQCIATQVDQIEHLTSQLEAALKSFSLVEQERDHVAQRLADREANIEQLTADLDQSRELLADCSEKAQQLNVVYHQTLAELEQARETILTSPAKEVKALTSEVEQESELTSEFTSEDFTDKDELATEALSASNDVDEDRPSEPPVEFQPPSFIDQYSHLLDENGLGQVEESLAPVTGPVGHSSESMFSSNTFSGEGESGDDGDLEAYMSNLMRRVRGDTSSDSTPSLATNSSESNGSHTSQKYDTAKLPVLNEKGTPAVTTFIEPLGLLELADLKANSGKPSQAIDLTAMRELANSSARSAIAKHRKRRHFEGALGKFLVTSIAAGTASCMIASAEHISHPLFLGGCAVGVVSIYWGFKLLGVLLELIRDGGTTNDPSFAEYSDQVDLLPIDGAVETSSQGS